MWLKKTTALFRPPTRDAPRQQTARPSSLYIGSNTLLCRLEAGGLIYLDTEDLSITPGLAMTGAWEPGVTALFRRRLKKGMRVVDVGANCGVYAVLATRAVGANGFVTALEPNPRLASLLRKSLIINGGFQRTRVIEGVALDRDDEVELGVPDQLYGSASILLGEPAEGRKLFKAQARRLDDWLSGNLKVDVLKVDAEGAEPLIWDGASKLLAQNRTLDIFIEFSPPMLQNLRPPGEFLKEIRSEGFNVKLIDLQTGRLTTVPDETLLNRPWSELLLSRH